MAHFEIDFHDKNSERFMISGRINQILRDMYAKFIIVDSVDTGDFFFRICGSGGRSGSGFDFCGGSNGSGRSGGGSSCGGRIW